MQIQPISYSHDSFPEEVLLKCFSYLNLDDMPIVERVCTIWNRVSSDDSYWEVIAFEKKINRDVETPSLRLKVLRSFAPYCQAARIIFPKYFEAAPLNLNLTHERTLIDKTLSCLNLTQESIIPIQKNMIEKLETIINMLKIQFIEDVVNPTKEDIERMISGFQLLICLKIYKADDLFMGAIKVSFDILDLPRILFIRSRILYKPQKPLEKSLFDRLDQTMQTNSLLPKYLSNYIEKPSAHCVFSLCSGYVFTTWLKTFGKSGDREKFLKDENVYMDLTIEYPPYIHALVKKMDKKEFKDLFHTSRFLCPLNDWINNSYSDMSSLFHLSEDPFHDYMITRMLKSYGQSLLAIRKD